MYIFSLTKHFNHRYDVIKKIQDLWLKKLVPTNIFDRRALDMLQGTSYNFLNLNQNLWSSHRPNKLIGFDRDCRKRTSGAISYMNSGENWPQKPDIQITVYPVPTYIPGS